MPRIDFKQLPVLLSLGVALLTLWLGSNLVVRPGLNHVHQAQAQLAEERHKSELIHQLEELRVQAAPWQRRLSSGTTSEWLITETARLAKEAGVRVVSMEPQSPVHVEGATKTSVSVGLECSYHQLGQFLSVVESSVQLITVERVQTGTSHGTTALPRVDLVLSSWQVAPIGGGV